MLDLKALLTKILEALNKFNVTTPSINVTASTGSVVSVNAKRFGNVVHLYLLFRNASSIASGSNVFVGTLTTTNLRPLIDVTGGTYYGNHALNGGLYTSGGIIIRNASNTAVQIASPNTASISFTYIVGGG